MFQLIPRKCFTSFYPNHARTNTKIVLDLLTVVKEEIRKVHNNEHYSLHCEQIKKVYNTNTISTIHLKTPHSFEKGDLATTARDG